MINKIKQFFVETRQEFAHVSWPSRPDAIRLTVIVIGISLGIALFLGLFDYIFSYLLKTFILKIQ